MNTTNKDDILRQARLEGEDDLKKAQADTKAKNQFYILVAVLMVLGILLEITGMETLAYWVLWVPGMMVWVVIHLYRFYKTKDIRFIGYALLGFFLFGIDGLSTLKKWLDAL